MYTRRCLRGYNPGIPGVYIGVLHLGYTRGVHRGVTPRVYQGVHKGVTPRVYPRVYKGVTPRVYLRVYKGVTPRVYRRVYKTVPHPGIPQGLRLFHTRVYLRVMRGRHAAQRGVPFSHGG